MPRFSLIIPCRDAAKLLPATLESLRAQTCGDWEALFVDLGSADMTPLLLARAAQADARIRRISAPDLTITAARNHAARNHARGDVLAFGHAGDIWAPDRLARIAAAFVDPFVDGVFARIGYYSEQPGPAQQRLAVPEGPLDVAQILAEDPVQTLANLAIRRGVFERSGGLRDDLAQGAGFEWLVRIIGRGAHVEGLDALLSWHRKDDLGEALDLAALRAGRAAALSTARALGYRPDPRVEAAHLRRAARRVLRHDQGAVTALRLALSGLAASPRGFLAARGHGARTLLGAAAAPVLPRPLRRALFSH